MSNPVVRSEIRARFEQVLAPLAFEYVDSINLATGTGELPAQWYTINFIASADDRITLGIPSLFRELGVASAFLFTPQQIGDALGTSAAQLLRDALANWSSADGQLRVLDCTPPADVDGGDFRGAWYALSVDVRYQFDRLVGDAEG